MNISRMTEEQVQSLLGDLVENTEPRIRKVKFQKLEPTVQSEKELDISLLSDVTADICVELGKAELTVREVLELEVGKVIELDKVAGEEVEVYINDQPFVSAEVVIINDAFGIRVSSFLDNVEE